jgi:hypothetical protein
LSPAAVRVPEMVGAEGEREGGVVWFVAVPPVVVVVDPDTSIFTESVAVPLPPSCVQETV